MISKAKRQKVYQKYGGHCAYCGKQLSMKEMTVDHVKPLSHGGSDDINNLRACCFACNVTKGQGSLRFLRLALAWPTMLISEMADFPTALRSSKKYKFFYEKFKITILEFIICK